MVIENLNTMIINGVRVDHNICTSTDSTEFVNAETQKRLLVIDYSARAYKPDNSEVFGTFIMDDNYIWGFVNHNLGYTINTPNKSLIKAEVLVFKRLVDSGEIIL